ncbi:DUF2076 domain-containing protein [Acetobacteraceae bacterium]|nr:DUF2076 domain-containing protein [Acetobacteraceae bacterium]
MNSEEQNIIGQFVARVGGGHGVQQALPPIDPEADRYIGQEFQRYPEARYRVTQLAVVQEAALRNAQSRIQYLENQLQQAKAALAQKQQSQGGGFFSNLFGGGRSNPAQGYPPPPTAQGMRPPPGYGQQYAPPPPQYGQPPMSAFQSSGTGFLGSALRTATGVAGGMLAAHAIEGLFSGHHEAGAGGFGEGGAGFGAGAAEAGGGYDPSTDPFAGSGMEDNGGFADDDFGGGFDGGDFGGFDDSMF